LVAPARLAAGRVLPELNAISLDHPAFDPDLKPSLGLVEEEADTLELAFAETKVIFGDESGKRALGPEKRRVIKGIGRIPGPGSLGRTGRHRGARDQEPQDRPAGAARGKNPDSEERKHRYSGPLFIISALACTVNTFQLVRLVVRGLSRVL